jgi:hypothetical protein
MPDKAQMNLQKQWSDYMSYFLPESGRETTFSKMCRECCSRGRDAAHEEERQRQKDGCERHRDQVIDRTSGPGKNRRTNFRLKSNVN